MPVKKKGSDDGPDIQEDAAGTATGLLDDLDDIDNKRLEIARKRMRKHKIKMSDEMAIFLVRLRDLGPLPAETVEYVHDNWAEVAHVIRIARKHGMPPEKLFLSYRIHKKGIKIDADIIGPVLEEIDECIRGKKPKTGTFRCILFIQFLFLNLTLILMPQQWTISSRSLRR